MKYYLDIQKGACSFLMIESQTPRYCFSSENFNTQTNTPTLSKKLYFLTGFLNSIVMIVKNMESLQIRFVHVTSNIKSHYLVICAERYILIFIIFLNITSPVVVIVI